MFAPDITLVTTSNVSRTYSQTSLVGGTSIRVDSTAALDTPRVLTISHAKKGSGVTVADRHLVKLENTVIPSAVPLKASVYVVMDIPRTGFDGVAVQDLVDQLVDFLSPTNITKLLHNEP